MGFRPNILLRVEGLLVAIGTLAVYGRLDGNWLLFFLLILAPDVSMLGYLAGTRVGAVVYNLFHTYALPVALGAYGFLTTHGLAVHIALIWSAHIGIDRMLGFGLKYPTGFKDTHLNRV
jgi:hypothetical protein